MNERAAGFALLEVVVAAALLALMFAMVLPPVMRAPGQAQFQLDLAQAIGALRLARAAAKFGQKDVVVAFDAGRHALVSSAGRATAIHARTLVELRAASAATAPDVITFFASGRSSGGTVLLRRNRLANSLSVNWVNGDVVRLQ